MATTRLVVVYYSRTGITERVVESLAKSLAGLGILVEVYRVLPVEEYSRPLHLNPRLVHDTLVRRGTDIRFEPREPRLEDCDVVVAASPVWYNTLAPPVQEFLRRLRGKGTRLAVITTSILEVDSSRIGRVVKELCGLEPALHVNVKSAGARDPTDLERLSSEISRKIKDLAGGGRAPR